MSWIRRFSNVFRQGRLNQEIEEELTTHIEEAIEQGSSPDAARKALGLGLSRESGTAMIGSTRHMIGMARRQCTLARASGSDELTSTEVGAASRLSTASLRGGTCTGTTCSAKRTIRNFGDPGMPSKRSPS